MLKKNYASRARDQREECLLAVAAVFSSSRWAAVLSAHSLKKLQEKESYL